MAKYATEQKKMLIEFLKSHPEDSFTVEELVGRLKETYGKDAPGASTVYRLVTGLLEDGRLRRFIRGNSRHFVYQIIDGEACHAHLHLRCTLCGRLLHLGEALSDQILKNVLLESCFAVNEEETVLLGRCRACQEGGGPHA